MAEVKALLFGDLVGTPGRRALFFALPRLRERYRPDIIVLNGENAQEGFGLTPELAAQLFAAGIDVITTGNHIWEDKTIWPELDVQDRILRPHNYSSTLPGKGWCRLTVCGRPLAVMNFQGRLQMPLTEDPFRSADTLLQELGKQTPLILVDFHGESTEEKEAFSHYLDGRVSLVVGTHTHVPTTDLRILKGGTGAVTDLGMCGAWPSVIGGRIDDSIHRLKTQLPVRVRMAESPGMVQGVVAVLDADTGRTLSLERVHETEE